MLECTLAGEPISIPGGATREISPGEPVTYTDLPIGAECVVTETATGGATSTTVDGGESAGVVVAAEEPAGLGVTNTFDVGEIRVVKSLSGPDAPNHEDDVVTVSLECTMEVNGEDVPIDIPGGPTRELSADDDFIAVYEDLPQGATCVVTETDAGSGQRGDRRRRFDHYGGPGCAGAAVGRVPAARWRRRVPPGRSGQHLVGIQWRQRHVHPGRVGRSALARRARRRFGLRAG